MFLFHAKRKDGFTLLIAVIIMAFVLSTGLSLTSIVVKELGITSTLRESMKAFYAVESGFECSRYWLLKETKFFTDPNQGTLVKNCYGETHNFGNGYSYSVDFYGGQNETSKFVNFEHNPSNPKDISLTIIGLNADENYHQNIVQRFREADVLISTIGLESADIILVIDTSTSICREDTPSECDVPYVEYDVMIERTQEFLDTLINENNSSEYINDLRIGRIGFANGTHFPIAPTSDPAAVNPSYFHIGLDVDGRTNLAKGLSEAYKLLDTSDEREDVIVVVTDGEPSYYVEDGNDIPADLTYIETNFPNFSYQDYRIDSEEGNGGTTCQVARDHTAWIADIYEQRGIQVNAIGIGISSEDGDCGDTNTYIEEDIVSTDLEGIYVPIEEPEDLLEAFLNLRNEISFKFLQIK